MPGDTKWYCCLCGDTNFGQTRVDQITKQLGLQSSETGGNQEPASTGFQNQAVSSDYQLESEVYWCLGYMLLYACFRLSSNNISSYLSVGIEKLGTWKAWSYWYVQVI